MWDVERHHAILFVTTPSFSIRQAEGSTLPSIGLSDFGQRARGSLTSGINLPSVACSAASRARENSGPPIR